MIVYELEHRETLDSMLYTQLHAPNSGGGAAAVRTRHADAENCFCVYVLLRVPCCRRRRRRGFIVEH